MNKQFKCIFVLSLLVVGLASCNVTKTYQSPDVQTVGHFRGGNLTDSTTIGSLPWKEVFTDTILQRLIGQGISENLDLQIAYARIRQAQAYYQQSGAAFLPDLSANASITKLRLSDAEGFGILSNTTKYQLGLYSTWEIDIWGRLRSARKANLANLLRTEAGTKAVQSGIVSGIANLYYTIMALDQQLVIIEETVSNWDTTVTTMRALKESGRVTEAAVVQSEAQRYATEVTIPNFKQRIREAENALSILLGISPRAIKRNRLDHQSIVTILNTGIPIQLLANRPDVQQAEFGYRSAFELTNVARTSFYPSLTITGSAGVSSFGLNNFFSSASLATNIGAGLAQPIFKRRINKTNLLLAKEQQQVALLSFKSTLLVAGQEVSDALSLYSTSLDKIQVRKKEITALQLSVDHTQELLQNGFANYLEVISARQNLLSAELARVNDKLQQSQAVVSLYTALGGGWR